MVIEITKEEIEELKKNGIEVETTGMEENDWFEFLDQIRHKEACCVQAGYAERARILHYIANAIEDRVDEA